MPRTELARRLQTIRLTTYRNMRFAYGVADEYCANACRPQRHQTNHSLRQPRERTNQERSSCESTNFRSILRLSAADERQGKRKRGCFHVGNNLFKGVDKIVGGIDDYASPLYEAPCYFGGLKNCCTFAHAKDKRI